MAGEVPWGSPEPEEPVEPAVVDAQTWHLRLVTGGRSRDLCVVSGTEQEVMDRLIEIATEWARTISVRTGESAGGPDGCESRLSWPGYQIMQDGRSIVVSELPSGREHRFTAYLLLASAHFPDATGSVVRFGPYQWRVLCTDAAGRQLLLSEDIVGRAPFRGRDEATTTTWGQFDLCAWLNGRPSTIGRGESGWAEWEAMVSPPSSSVLDGETWWAQEPPPRCFLEGFTKEEVRRIHPVRLPAAAVDSRVFLLSLEGAKEWFASDSSRIARYRGVPGWWWLRSPGGAADVVANVGAKGNIDTHGRYAWASGGVRPALWLNPPRGRS
ncbi:MAG: DUF6273 domain-containing protein [Micrococcales bacterium]|nr:DUF6273 domain-containing protein [Micrococcales bacterium]